MSWLIVITMIGWVAVSTWLLARWDRERHGDAPRPGMPADSRRWDRW